VVGGGALILLAGHFPNMIWAVGDLVRGLALHAENDRCRNNDEREREMKKEGKRRF
jgi:hypothetical protein